MDLIGSPNDPSELKMAPNAQLRGEQRYHPHLKHCAINAKFEVDAKMPSVVNPS
jgi:hypothetical protein